MKVSFFHFASMNLSFCFCEDFIHLMQIVFYLFGNSESIDAFANFNNRMMMLIGHHRMIHNIVKRGTLLFAHRLQKRV